MTSIGKRLLNSTADLAAAVAAKTPPSDTDPKAAVPRTAPGHMLAARNEFIALQSELTELREKLKRYDGSIPAIKLDPASVRASRWANRHEVGYSTAAFTRLKLSVEQAGGNVQPILVRKVEDGGYEVVFGHRRHRACLELGLPVLAVIWEGAMSDVDLFMQMDRENREREDPSPFEQGATYAAALEQGLFQSQRRLAEALGLSHTWVRRAINVASLPPAIVAAFGSPLVIQTIHAEALATALDSDRKSVLRRAEKLRADPKKLPPARVVEFLVGQTTQASRPQSLQALGKSVGTWKRDSAGRVVITLAPTALSDEQIQDVLARITDLATRGVET